MPFSGPLANGSEATTITMAAKRTASRRELPEGTLRESILCLGTRADTGAGRRACHVRTARPTSLVCVIGIAMKVAFGVPSEFASGTKAVGSLVILGVIRGGEGHSCLKVDGLGGAFALWQETGLVWLHPHRRGGETTMLYGR
jgi:hypothetical protein